MDIGNFLRPPCRRLSGGSDWSAASSGSSCEASLWDWERKEPLAILPEAETSQDRRQSEVSECLSEGSGDYQPFPHHHHFLQPPGEERRLSSLSVSSASGEEELPSAGQQPGPGMWSVGGWLRYHRLHKYSSALVCLTYHQLLHLTQDQLLSMGVTKGAARKIYKCVQNLHRRPETLTGICEKLEAGRGDLRQHMVELEEVIRSPVLVEEEGGRSLVEQIVVVMTRLCSSLLLCPRTDHKTASQFVSLLDCCLACPHYSAHHRQLFQSWKQKVKIIWTSQPLSSFLGNY